MMRVCVPAAAVLLLAGPAYGQGPPCAPRDVVLTTMLERYGEVPAGVGLAANGSLLELLTSPGGATWTLLLTQANGISCMAASGQGWRTADPVVPEQPT